MTTKNTAMQQMAAQPATQDNRVTTHPDIAANLHIVDFDALSPSLLQQQVEQAIATASQCLDHLQQRLGDNVENEADAALSAAQALAQIVHFERLNLNLDRYWGLVSHLNSVMSNDAIRDCHRRLLPLLSAFSTRVGQHQPLYHCYQMVKNDREFFATLSPARQRAIELALKEFQLSGVALPSNEQAVYASIQNELSTLSAKFSDNVLDATQAFSLPLSDDDLAGLPASSLAMLAAAGEQLKTKQQEQALANPVASSATSSTDNETKTQLDAPASETLAAPNYVATLDMPVYLAIITHADKRQLRETLYKAYVTRASEFDSHLTKDGESLDNSEIMAKILALRAQKAQLLGFNNYTQLSLSKKMADNAIQVEDFLLALAKEATPTAQQDLAQLQAQAAQYGIATDDLQPWDFAYLSEKIKQDRFKLSQEEIRPYFPLPTVLDGLFTIVNKLFGICVKEATQSVATWHKDVRFYQLFDADGQVIGGFYFDLYARATKRGGAWMSGFQPRYRFEPFESSASQDQTITHYPATSSGIDINDEAADIETLTAYQQLPLCFMVGSFTPPNGDKPSLLTHTEVTTLFHEFGHGLHHLLTTVDISDVAGVNGVEWDAVELPSQFLENWAWDVEGIRLISAHVDTGEPLPKAMLDAMLAAKNFQSGMQTLRQIEFSLFDLRLHAKSPAPDYCGILALLDTVRSEVSITKTPDYNRFANGFSHIFAGGYAAGYYSYKWAELLSADAFSRFEEEGVFNPQTGQAFRKHILSVGGSIPAKTNFEGFRGRAASIDALLRHSGFGTDAKVDKDSTDTSMDTSTNTSMDTRSTNAKPTDAEEG